MFADPKNIGSVVLFSCHGIMICTDMWHKIKGKHLCWINVPDIVNELLRLHSLQYIKKPNTMTTHTADNDYLVTKLAYKDWDILDVAWAWADTSDFDKSQIDMCSGLGESIKPVVWSQSAVTRISGEQGWQWRPSLILSSHINHSIGHSEWCTKSWERPIQFCFQVKMNTHSNVPILL